MTELFLLAAIATSIATIVWLCYGDPKRRRIARMPAAGHSPGMRRFLAAGALTPGLVLVILGDSAAFLVWLGCCAVGGWLVTQVWCWPDPE